MKFGMNLLLWTGSMDDTMLPVLEMLKAAGFDGVELPVFTMTPEQAVYWGKRLDELGLRRTACTVRSEDDNPISADPAMPVHRSTRKKSGMCVRA